MLASAEQPVLLEYDNGIVEKSRHTSLYSIISSIQLAVHPKSRTISKQSPVGTRGVSQEFLIPKRCALPLAVVA
jgi:hypothetical protein